MGQRIGARSGVHAVTARPDPRQCTDDHVDDDVPTPSVGLGWFLDTLGFATLQPGDPEQPPRRGFSVSGREPPSAEGPGIPKVSSTLDSSIPSNSLDNVDEGLLREARAARDRLVEAQHNVEVARVEYHHAIRRLHTSGGSMREIAHALGLSHQRVHQIIDEGAKPTAAKKPTLLKRLTGGATKECMTPQNRPGGQMFDRMSPDAREAMVLAQDEACFLHHNYIGTEHILLGLLGTDLGFAARMLTRAGADQQHARVAIDQIIGPGPAEPPNGPLRFTPRSKKVLELARHEAKRDHSPHVRSEHVLLGLAREGKGVGAAILTQLGVGYDDLRKRLDRVALACSFCERSGLDVDHLVAGPGVFICERCITDATQVATRPDEPLHAPMTVVPPDQQTAACSFCGKKPSDVDHLVSAPNASVCGDCLALCREIHAEEQGKPEG